MKFIRNAAKPVKCPIFICFLFLLSALPHVGPAEAQAGSLHAVNASGVSAQEAHAFRKPSIPEEAHVSEHLFGLPGLRNMGRVAPGVYRGAQPSSEGYASLKKLGIKTVINLRTTVTERSAVETAGMKSVELPLAMINDIDAEKIEKIVALMDDPANRPVFVHCKLGQDRTGIVVAAYRMKIEGWPLPLAEAEMESFGFNGVWVNLRHFLHRYAARLEPRKRADNK